MKNRVGKRLRRMRCHCALLIVPIFPLSALADTWQLQVGAQTGDRALQAFPSLPNEIWDSPRRQSTTRTFVTDEVHTVTFLTPRQVRPSRFAGCPGARPDVSVYDGTACVNCGVLQDGATTPVAIPLTGKFKLVCLAYADMTATIHVLAESQPLPHDQAFYTRQAASEGASLLSHARSSAHVHTKGNAVVAGAGKIAGTSESTETASVMRFMDGTKVIHVGDTVEWTTSEAIANHSVTLGPEPDPINFFRPLGGWRLLLA